MFIRTAATATLLFACLSSLVGCKEETTTAKSDLGESCTRSQDCGSDLSCIDNRCVAESNSGPTDGGVATGGKGGESCTRRGDCQLGLACVDQVCQTEMLGNPSDAGVPSQRGQRGESCAARNDCKAGLGCVNGRCLESDYALVVQPKECYRVDCEATADCCANFVPGFNCALLKSECDSGMAESCRDYSQDCVCNSVCEESQCVRRNTCFDNTDCGGFRCVSQRCVQCAVKSDCADPTAECVSGTCKRACKNNEECPLFYSCTAGKCVDTGCKTDRECFFATEDPRSTCVESECVTPCDTDSECIGDFNVCDKNRCVFVGCESDTECRALFKLANIRDSEKAVCRMPMVTP